MSRIRKPSRGKAPVVPPTPPTPDGPPPKEVVVKLENSLAVTAVKGLQINLLSAERI